MVLFSYGEVVPHLCHTLPEEFSCYLTGCGATFVTTQSLTLMQLMLYATSLGLLVLLATPEKARMGEWKRILHLFCLLLELTYTHTHTHTHTHMHACTLTHTHTHTHTHARTHRFGSDNLPQVLSEVYCSTSDFLVILQCSYSEYVHPSSCRPSDDLSVICCEFIIGTLVFAHQERDGICILRNYEKVAYVRATRLQCE